MAHSADVNAGDDILASQYNNLRKDVLDTSTGHDHDGSGSKALATDSIVQTQVKVGTGSASGTLNDGDWANVSMNIYCFFPQVTCDASAYMTWRPHTGATPAYIGRFGLRSTQDGNDYYAYWNYIPAS